MKTLMVMVLGLCGSACGETPAVEHPVVGITFSDQRMEDWLIEGLSPSLQLAIDDGGSDTLPVEDAFAPAARCSIVQFCNAPGRDGTRCLQRGCGAVDALVECSREAPKVCGWPVCPWVFVARDGRRFINGSCL
jgi:hypothetical protein